MRGRGTPWPTRRPVTAISGPENAQAEGQEEVKPYQDQENRFEEIESLVLRPTLSSSSDTQINHTMALFGWT